MNSFSMAGLPRMIVRLPRASGDAVAGSVTEGAFMIA